MSDEIGGGASRSTEPATGSSAATDVSLREFLADRIDDVRRTMNERFTSDTAARMLQAAEYERRLGELNNESGRLQQAVAKNVSADTWDAFESQYRLDRERDDIRMKNVEHFQSRLAGAMVLATIFVPGITALIVYLVTRGTMSSNP